MDIRCFVMREKVREHKVSESLTIKLNHMVFMKLVLYIWIKGQLGFTWLVGVYC